MITWGLPEGGDVLPMIFLSMPRRPRHRYSNHFLDVSPRLHSMCPARRGPGGSQVDVVPGGDRSMQWSMKWQADASLPPSLLA